MSDQPEDRPRRPRVEPEIIPPGRHPYGAGEMPSAEAYFFRFGDSAGVHRMYIARPGLPSILLGLLVLGTALAIVMFLFVGLMLLLPVVIGAIALALVFGAFGRSGRW